MSVPSPTAEARAPAPKRARKVEDEAPVVEAKTEKAKKETTKPKETAKVEEKPKPAPKDESAEDDGKEDEDDKPKSAGRAGYPNLDDPDGDED